MLYIKGMDICRWYKHGNHIGLQNFCCKSIFGIRIIQCVKKIYKLQYLKFCYPFTLDFCEHILYPNSPSRIIKSKTLYSLFPTYSRKIPSSYKNCNISKWYNRSETNSKYFQLHCRKNILTIKLIHTFISFNFCRDNEIVFWKL